MEHSPKHVLVLQHHDCEGLGIIADALRHASVTPLYIRSFEGQSVPKELADAAGLIVMGGPQSVYEQDEFPFLRDEIALIESALNQEKPVLGICLGSQLLAVTLGAKVYRGRTREIGWNRVTLTEFARNDSLFAGVQESFTPFHWHGDISDLPHGSTLLVSSPLTANQAFRHGRNTYGLLFHMEMTFPQVRTMVEAFADDLHAAGLNGSAIKLNAHTHLTALQQIGHAVFTRWTALLR